MKNACEELDLITGNKSRAMSDIMQAYSNIDFTPVRWTQRGRIIGSFR